MSTQIQNEEFFVIRSPRLPFSYISRLGSDSQSVRAALNDWLQNEEVVESLYVASPAILESLNTWRTSPNSKQGKKIELTLLKYFIRMSSRPTPFGLFSGIHTGKVGAQTCLRTSPLSYQKRKTRLDMHLLSKLKEQIQTTYDKNKELKFYSNPSHYFVNDQCRYIEPYFSGENRQYRLSAIESDEYFLFLIRQASTPQTIEELTCKFKMSFADADENDVKGYIFQLIEASILLADVPLPLTNGSPDTAFIDALNNINERQLADHLDTALLALSQLDKNKAGEISQYKSVHKHMTELPVEVQESKLLQVDIYKDFEHCELDSKAISRLGQQLKLLHALSSPSSNPLNQFIRQFNKRHEGEMVPLMQLLDDETGISFSEETGYESSLIAGLDISVKEDDSAAARTESSAFEKLVLSALNLPENRNKDVIKLTSKLLKQNVEPNRPNKYLPHSFAALVSLFEDKNNNLITQLKTCYGPSAANLLGRFCHLDETLLNNVKQHLQTEESFSEDVIFAEVVHMPDGRPGNIIARPKLRDFEIVFMADSITDSEYQISVDDLYVWVEFDTVKLWSKRLQKQIIPRLSSAHNYTARSLGVYRFLCALQSQSFSLPSLELPLADTCFVPRIMLDNLILAEKCWRLPRKEFIEAFTDAATETKKLAFMNKYKLDDNVCFSVGDNVLHLNLQNPLMIDILLAETKQFETIELTEALMASYNSAVKSNDGESFCNEVIIPFTSPTTPPLQTFINNRHEVVNSPKTKRHFSPGSDWMSLKLYSGNSAVESLLTEHLYPLIQANRELFDQWFFIRYADPDWHLRLRFKGTPETLYGQLLPKLHRLFDPMLEKGEVIKVELFTYTRETERYGGPKAIQHAENFFMFDSELITQSLLLCENFGDEIRWRTLALITDQLLDLFDYSSKQKFTLISALREAFGNEFKETSVLRKKFGNKYKAIENILVKDLQMFTHQDPTQLSEERRLLFTIIQQWKDRVRAVVQSLKDCTYNSSVTQLDDLVSSLLHMSNNRMFKAYGREQEFVMHDFMRRYYLSNSKLGS